MTEKSAAIAVVGLGVMGWNLALNLADRGFTVALYNRTREKTESLAKESGKFIPCPDPDELIRTLERPRRILMMLPAGSAVDDMMAVLLPRLEAGDCLVDGGNSHYTDTERRIREAAKYDVSFLGLGVSGGEVGARRGPSLMAGGAPAAWEAMCPALEAIAARTPAGDVCAGYFGAGGSGHFIKMVHNGIEYAVMEIIAEVYWLLKYCNHLGNDEIAGIFKRWNAGALHSYLLEISSVIVRERDPETGGHLIEQIRDCAQSKGTGIWCCQSALELGVAVPTIYEALALRQLSEAGAMRDYAVGRWGGQTTGTPMALECLETTFYASTVMAYAQGFALLHRAGETYGWNFDFAAIAAVWRSGCIIRAALLTRIQNAYISEPELPTFAFSGDFSRDLTSSHSGWSRVVAQATTGGLPIPAIGSALEYFDTLRADRLPANLLQAQRDYFGAHRFERIDQPRHESFHHQWPEFEG